MKKLFATLVLSTVMLAPSILLADMVNINKASAAAMQHNLDGIGEKKAVAIVTYRNEYGAFKTLEEIKEVKGIGDGIFKKIKANLSLTEGVTELSGVAGAKGKADVTVKPEQSKPAAAADKSKETAVKNKQVDKDLAAGKQ